MGENCISVMRIAFGGINWNFSHLFSFNISSDKYEGKKMQEYREEITKDGTILVIVEYVLKSKKE